MSRQISTDASYWFCRSVSRLTLTSSKVVPSNARERQDRAPMAFSWIATSSMAAIPPFETSDLKEPKSGNALATVDAQAAPFPDSGVAVGPWFSEMPHSPNLIMYCMCWISVAPVAEAYNTAQPGQHCCNSSTRRAARVLASRFFALWASSKQMRPSPSLQWCVSQVRTCPKRLCCGSVDPAEPETPETSIEYVRKSTPSR
mmetsp:Transcript_82215/g.229156  ORF Transcript_82215/g.229156 Transcript_82215/m.229156 type:complete len:201 (-) Transcript_82215:221-823(-)